MTDTGRLPGFVPAHAVALDAPTRDQVRAAIAAAGQRPCRYVSSPASGGRPDIAPLCLS